MTISLQKLAALAMDVYNREDLRSSCRSDERSDIRDCLLRDSTVSCRFAHTAYQ
jgi:hypothetical protein